MDSMIVFFFKDTPTTEIYTLSLHDALPIFGQGDRESRQSVDGESHRESGLGLALWPGLGRHAERLRRAQRRA